MSKAGKPGRSCALTQAGQGVVERSAVGGEQGRCGPPLLLRRQACQAVQQIDQVPGPERAGLQGCGTGSTWGSTWAISVTISGDQGLAWYANLRLRGTTQVHPSLHKQAHRATGP